MTKRISLDAEAFKYLISGLVVTDGDTEIALKDIGYDEMYRILCEQITDSGMRNPLGNWTAALFEIVEKAQSEYDPKTGVTTIKLTRELLDGLINFSSQFSPHLL